MKQTTATVSPLVSALLKVPQVAALLNVQPSTVYEWVRMDYIPHIRLGTGKEKPCVRFDAQEISTWLAAKKEAGRLTRFPTMRYSHLSPARQTKAVKVLDSAYLLTDTKTDTVENSASTKAASITN